MIRSLFFLLCVLAAAPAQAAAGCVYRSDSAASSALSLKRGVNLSGWWEGETYNALRPRDLEKIRALGFDFVRLPLNPYWFGLDDDEEAEKLAQLHCDLVSILNAGLAVIVDLHDTGGFKQNLVSHPDEALSVLGSAWKRGRPAFEGLPADRILLGLYNEPGIDPDEWWKIQGRLVAGLRRLYPANTFVAAGGDRSGPWDLEDKQPYGDGNVIYDFHYYLPIYFTHHGGDWMDSSETGDKSVKPPYPVTGSAGDDDPELKEYLRGGWNREGIASDIREVSAWQKRTHARIVCLEFGVYRRYVDDRSRYNWLRDMRELLEDAGIPWALWEYRGSFGLVELPRQFDSGMATALGLKPLSSQ